MDAALQNGILFSVNCADRQTMDFTSLNQMGKTVLFPKCITSLTHRISMASWAYRGNHASMMNVKKGPVFVTFTDDVIEEERPDFAYPAEDAVFCVIRK